MSTFVLCSVLRGYSSGEAGSMGGIFLSGQQSASKPSEEGPTSPKSNSRRASRIPRLSVVYRVTSTVISDAIQPSALADSMNTARSAVLSQIRTGGRSGESSACSTPASSSPGQEGSAIYDRLGLPKINPSVGGLRAFTPIGRHAVLIR